MPSLDPERWREVSLRLDEALDLPEEERTRWIASLRERDPGMAEDLCGLLEDHKVVREARFLEQPHGVLPDARRAGDANDATALAGRVVGTYRLVSQIGHGGMGVVWLAERCDGSFEGRAAVKLLNTARFTRSEARIRREATILARVTHPNIAHLIDAGVSADGQPYLVLEFVDGKPIDQYCDERTLDVRSRILLALDVLDAVSHAHTHRIVHRDIKASNVLVRNDGHVKLLDFGIAQLLEHDGQPSIGTTLTLELSAALTPASAAPEQVTGRAISVATDVYSLGVLLYILLTGQHPHGEAKSPVELMKAIVDRDPLPLSAVYKESDAAVAERAARRAATPKHLHKTLKGDLETIVTKALRKNPDERYESAAALADDLRRYLAAQPITARRDSLGRRGVRFAQQHAATMAAVAVAALALAAAGAFYATRSGATIAPPVASEGRAPVPVTSEAGDETWPSLSPDATRVAFSWGPPNAQTTRIAVKTIGSEGVVQLTDGSADDIMPVWSPDGRSLAFLRSFREPRQRVQIGLVPTSGGPVRVLFERETATLRGLSWWEAGNALLFAIHQPADATFRLTALDLSTLGVRTLTHPPPAPLLGAPGDFMPAVSPDGRRVAFVRETHEGRDVHLLDLSTSVERQVTHDRHRIAALTWAPDGRTLIMSSFRSGVEGLYRIALEDGSIVRLPNTGDLAQQPMGGPGGLVFMQAYNDSNIHRIELRDGRPIGTARPLIASSRVDSSPHISPDGRHIAFVSLRGGGQDIWISAADGTNPRRITSLAVTSGPRWSPDGRWIAFGALAPGLTRPDIWVVDAAGGTPRPLTTEPSYETVLGWAADGAAVYVTSDRSNAFQVWRVPVAGGPATQVTHDVGLRAQESSDGRYLYYANDVPEVWRRPLLGASAEQLIFTFPKNTHWGGEWAIGARGIYYLNERAPGGVAIDYLPFGSTDPARAIRVASLTAPPTGTPTFAIAPDESWLVWVQDDYRNSDVMMIAQR
jgi:serine/threonine protein kinase/Tol biopolymer transport system component